MFNKEIRIGNKTVGGNNPCMIVAELSGNHNGDYNRAVEIIHAAVHDIIKKKYPFTDHAHYGKEL